MTNRVFRAAVWLTAGVGTLALAAWGLPPLFEVGDVVRASVLTGSGVVALGAAVLAACRGHGAGD